MRCATDVTGVAHTGVTAGERAIRMRCRVVSAAYTVVHLVIPVVYMTAGTERAPVVMMMVCVAVMPVPVMRPAVMAVPPVRIISPVPRRVPRYPSCAPEPIVYYRTVNVNRLYDVVRTIHVLITDHLNAYLILLIFLYVYRGYVLEYILCQNGLEYDQTFVAFTYLYYAQVIDFPVTVEVQVTECAVRVVEHRLELFQVPSLCKQLSYHLQIESFRDVRTVGRNGHCFVCP